MKRFSLPSQPLTIAIISLLGIGCHWGLKSFSSASLATWVPLLPLWIVVGVGGVPLLNTILRKLLGRDYGADALAAVALVVAAVLADYVTAALIVLMLSSGQALDLRQVESFQCVAGFVSAHAVGSSPKTEQSIGRH